MFHAQQCVEKYLKAALISYGIEAGRTHDLVVLHQQLKSLRPEWQVDVAALERLTHGGVSFRYPGSDTTEADAQFAISTACQLRADLYIWLSETEVI